MINLNPAVELKLKEEKENRRWTPWTTMDFTAEPSPNG
jgi:hypothetical protein